MCLIVRSEKEKPLSKELINEFMNKNSDGWGMMWIQNNTMRTDKRHESKPEECFEIYDRVKQFNPVLHFRWKTHGAIDPNNTHPFYCGYGIFLMHNGVINGASTSELSDTGHFVKDWLFPLLKEVNNPHEFIRSATFKHIMEDKIGSNNRVILGDRGGYVIFNEKAWHTCTSERTGIKGVLVSNTYAWGEHSFGVPKVVTHTHTTWGGVTIRGVIEKVLSKRERKRLARELATAEANDIRPDGFWPGTVSEYGVRNHLGALLDQVVGNIYVNKEGEVWLRWKTSFKREAGLDAHAKNRLAKIKEEKEEDTCALVHEINHETGVITQMVKKDGVWCPVTKELTKEENDRINAVFAQSTGLVPINDPDAGATEEDDDTADAEAHASIFAHPASGTNVTVEQYESYVQNILKEYRAVAMDINELENLAIADGAEAARVIHRLFQQERYLMN